MKIKTFFFGIFFLIFASIQLKTLAIPAQPTNLYLKRSNLIAQNSSSEFLNFNDGSSQSNDNFNKIIFLMGLIGAGALIWYFSQFRQTGKSSFIPTASNSNTQLLDRVSPKLRRQLLRQINDPKTVNRLLIGIQKNNPDRSPNWIAEKAIYDFRRGR